MTSSWFFLSTKIYDVYRSSNAIFFFCVATAQLEPRPLHCVRILDNTQLDTQPEGPFRTSDQLVAKAQHKKKREGEREASMPSAVFKPTIPTIERQQNCVLDRTATRVRRWSNKRG